MIRFVRWSSSRNPRKEAGREKDRNHSKWHLIADGSRYTFCGRSIHASRAPVRPEYVKAQLYPLMLEENVDIGRGICDRCAVSQALWSALKMEAGG